MISFDQIDLILLDELQRDSKQSVKELAKKVNLSITPVHERIKKLEALNVIQNYVAVVRRHSLRSLNNMFAIWTKYRRPITWLVLMTFCSSLFLRI